MYAFFIFLNFFVIIIIENKDRKRKVVKIMKAKITYTVVQEMDYNYQDLAEFKLDRGLNYDIDDPDLESEYLDQIDDAWVDKVEAEDGVTVTDVVILKTE